MRRKSITLRFATFRCAPLRLLAAARSNSPRQTTHPQGNTTCFGACLGRRERCIATSAFYANGRAETNGRLVRDALSSAAA
ncbi:hypothetical protein EJ06DRAFT_528460, partial [Trichodelitschia bisporula]